METQQNQEMKVEKTKLSAGFFFLSFGFLITLIVSVVSFLSLSFEIFNKQFPDVLNASYVYGYDSYGYEGARMALATLIIFFPICLLTARFWRKYVLSGMSSSDAVLKKWLMYFVMFLSSSVLAIDLVTLIRYFVSGEITSRFLLKVFTVIVVALFSGLYFIFEARGKNKILGMNTGILFSVKSSVLVLALIVWSFVIIGTPSEQRAWRLDERRVQDLQNIQWQVINYWQQKEKLPEKLEDLASPLTGYSLPVDPEFEKGSIYSYAVKDKKMLKFELCANFSKQMPKGWREQKGGMNMPYPVMDYPTMKDSVSVYNPYYGGGINESWDHEAGKTCFERTIDKDIYPPYPKPLSK